MTVFIIIAMVGFVFLLISALFGHDTDHDFHLEAAHEVSFGEHPSPFSTRVISLFMVAFGAAGAIAHIYGMGITGASLVGLGAGLIVAFSGYKLIELFMQQQSTSVVTEEQLVGTVGQVSVAIPADGVGQISVEVNEKRMYPMARAAAAGTTFPEGVQVKIVRSSGSTVYVDKV